jgi:hypothetical protein
MLKKKINFLVGLLFLGFSYSLLLPQDEVIINEEEADFESFESSRESLSELESKEKDFRRDFADRPIKTESGMEELTEIEKVGNVEEPDVATEFEVTNKSKDDLKKVEFVEGESVKKLDELPVEKVEELEAVESVGDIIEPEVAQEGGEGVEQEPFGDELKLERDENSQEVELNVDIEEEETEESQGDVETEEEVEMENIEKTLEESENQDDEEPVMLEESIAQEEPKPEDGAKEVILLSETDGNLVENEVVAADLDSALAQGKILGKKINDIVEKLRIIRNELHDKYYDNVDKHLDKLLQEIGLQAGEAKGEGRFKFLNESVKKEYLNEWEKVKTKITEIDDLETELLDKLKSLDEKYEKAVEKSIEARKLNLDIFNISDNEKINNFLNKLKSIEESIGKFNQEIVQTIKKEIEDFVNNIIEKFKVVEKEFNDLKEKGLDLDKYEQTLEDAKSGKDVPRWRKLVENSVDRSLDYISVFSNKVKVIWSDWSAKVKNIYSTFIDDIKNKAKDLKNNKNEKDEQNLKEDSESSAEEDDLINE